MAVATAAGMYGKPHYHSVLVVDGERHMAWLVQVNLERSGFEVVCAYSAEESIEKLVRETPDFLMMNAILLFIPNSTDTESDKARNSVQTIILQCRSIRWSCIGRCAMVEVSETNHSRLPDRQSCGIVVPVDPFSRQFETVTTRGLFHYVAT
jgi:hypothetical protein